MKDNHFKKGFADRLYNIIEQRDITRRELSDAIGVSYPALASYLAGREVGKGALPPLETAAKLADILGVSLDELCGRVPSTAPPLQRTLAEPPTPVTTTDAQQRLKDIYEASVALHFSVSLNDGEAVALTSSNRFVRMFFEQMRESESIDATLGVFSDLQVYDGELVDPVTFRVMKSKEGSE